MSKAVKEHKSHHTRILSEIPDHLSIQVTKELGKVDNLNFNVFYLDGLIQKKTLYYVLSHILNKYNFVKDLLHEENFANFMHEITDGYNRKIVYHNDLHAADVLQTTYILISQGDLVNVSIFL